MDRSIAKHIIQKESVLIDTCCGPCAIPLEEYDVLKDKNIILYVTNSNVHPYSEYEKRLESIKAVSKNYENSIFIDTYDPTSWFSCVKGYENEPEGADRCIICYIHRLERLANHAKTNNIHYITTTLTTGTTKDASIINAIGETIAKRYGLIFLGLDLKKNNGYLKSVQMSKKLNLYRQKYCGCIYSLNASEEKILLKNKISL